MLLLAHNNLDPKTPMPFTHGGSPEIDFFNVSQRVRHASRWKEDWEELELLVSQPIYLGSGLILVASTGQRRIWICGKGSQ
jgi:hypothetical protein